VTKYCGNQRLLVRPFSQFFENKFDMAFQRGKKVRLTSDLLHFMNTLVGILQLCYAAERR